MINVIDTIKNEVIFDDIRNYLTNNVTSSIILEPQHHIWNNVGATFKNLRDILTLHKENDNDNIYEESYGKI